jgi:glutamate-1-semialdehyde 2,1-aminomutase
MSIRQSEIMFEKSKQIVPGGVHSPVRAFRGVGGVPRFIQSASGAHLEDVDGNKYLDFCMSWGPLIFGHQDPEIKEAVQSALHRGWSYGAAEPYSLELADLIISSIPWVQKIRFVNSGTEAVMSALRLARAATGGVSESVASETIVVPLDDLKHLEQVFDLHGKEIAAIIVEGIPANNGLLLQRDDFLKQVSKIAKKAGSLFILDEVITGFRVAFGGIAELSGIEPDLVTYGKVIGGGFPVGAFGGKAEIMNLIAPSGPVYQAGTLSANPVAMTAGITTLLKLKRDNPYAELETRTEKLSKELEKIAQEFDAPCKVQRFGSIFWSIFGKAGSSDGFVRRLEHFPSEHKATYTKNFHSLLEKEIYLAPSAFEVSFLSTAHTEENLNHFLKSVRATFMEKK